MEWCCLRLRWGLARISIDFLVFKILGLGLPKVTGLLSTGAVCANGLVMACEMKRRKTV